MEGCKRFYGGLGFVVVGEIVLGWGGGWEEVGEKRWRGGEERRREVEFGFGLMLDSV
jgi:hypothetical protein